MQPTDVQADVELEFLDLAPAHGSERLPFGSANANLRTALQDLCLPDGLLEELETKPAVRPEYLEKARIRLEHGDTPSPDELAERIMGRLTCEYYV